MLRAMLFFLTIFTALLAFHSEPSFAQADNKATVNIKPPPPTLGKINNKYKDIFETLRPEQQDFLKQLEKANTKSNEPYFEIMSQNKTLNACAKLDETIMQTHGDLFTNFKLTKLDELRSNQKNFYRLTKQADFIDQKILRGHIRFYENLQSQLLSGMADISTSMIAENKEGKGNELCNELKQELENEYSAPYAVPASNPAAVGLMRDSMTGKIKSCSIAVRHASEKGLISTAIVFADIADQGVNFDFSTKIFASQKQNLPVEDAWFDAGPINSRFHARISKPSQDMLVGNLPLSNIVPVLQHIKRHPLVAGAKATNWDHTVVFEISVKNPEDVDKMANCVAALAPSLKEPLERAGFTVTPDGQHEKGKASGTNNADLLYKTTAMSGDLSNPGACIWQFPTIKQGNAEVGGIMITGGFIADDHIYNNSTVFWLLGNQGPTRLSFTDGQFRTKTSKGEMIDSADYAKDTVKGQRYEIIMPFSAHLPFINGIYTNGLNIIAKAEGMEKPFTQTFKPPHRKAYQVYYDCMKNLFDDLERRKKEP